MKNILLTSAFLLSILLFLPLQSVSKDSTSSTENELLEFKFIKLVDSPKEGYSGIFEVKNSNNKDLYGFSLNVKFYEDEKYITWTSYSQFNTKTPTIKGGETKELTVLYGIASSINRIEVEVTGTTYK